MEGEGEQYGSHASSIEGEAREDLFTLPTVEEQWMALSALEMAEVMEAVVELSPEEVNESLAALAWEQERKQASQRG